MMVRGGAGSAARGRGLGACGEGQCLPACPAALAPRPRLPCSGMTAGSHYLHQQDDAPPRLLHLQRGRGGAAHRDGVRGRVRRSARARRRQVEGGTLGKQGRLGAESAGEGRQQAGRPHSRLRTSGRGSPRTLQGAGVARHQIEAQHGMAAVAVHPHACHAGPVAGTRHERQHRRGCTTPASQPSRGK